MLYAKPTVDSPLKIPPAPKSAALCPHCDGEVLSKCGTLKIWHWAHKRNKDCDSWSEGEGPWHLGWKARVPVECCEVSMDRDGVRHRADILVPNGGPVVELQHSPIPAPVIAQRESFYGNMVWLFDAAPFVKRFDIGLRGLGYSRFFGGFPRKKGFYDERRWSWKHPRRSILSARKPVILDLGKEGIKFVTRYKKRNESGIFRQLSDYYSYEEAVVYERKPDERLFLVSEHHQNLNEGKGYFLNYDQFIGALRGDNPMTFEAAG